MHIFRSTSFLKKKKKLKKKRHLGKKRWFFLTQKLLRVTISQKLRIAQKKRLCKKWASGQFQFTLQIWSFLKKVEFLGAQNVPFGRPWRPNAIWNFAPISFFSILRIFYVKMATVEGGWGVCMSLVATGPDGSYMRNVAFILEPHEYLIALN